jgi:medium-chain acyl-[acyl-carrier-protein] hydrolase
MGNTVRVEPAQSATLGQPCILRLFCFPYAGGAAAIYRQWSKLLPSYQIVPIEFPGHSSRIEERLFRRIDPLVEEIVGNFLPKFEEQPFAFFGHSMGALVAFEVARKLAARHHIAPTCLFVSGRRAPHLKSGGARVYDLHEDGLVGELRRLNGTPREILESQELLQLLLPAVRADFELIHTYKYCALPSLSCPIVAFGGSEDGETPRKELDAWRLHTRRSFSLHMLPGDHFFQHSAQELLLQIIGQELRGLRSEDWRLEPVLARITTDQAAG